jgi:hypothetical protein
MSAYSRNKGLIALTCSWCKTDFTRRAANVKATLTRNPKASFYCGKPCLGKAISRTGNTAVVYRGGRMLTHDGYVLIRVGNSYVREHRYIMEKYLCRKLLPTEHVHHRNRITTDNRLANLEVLDIRVHGRISGHDSAGKSRPTLHAIRVDDYALLRALYMNPNISTKEIAKTLGVHVSTITGYARKLGLPIRKQQTGAVLYGR